MLLNLKKDDMTSVEFTIFDAEPSLSVDYVHMYVCNMYIYPLLSTNQLLVYVS
jgi:hypothetical protein